MSTVGEVGSGHLPLLFPRPMCPLIPLSVSSRTGTTQESLTIDEDNSKGKNGGLSISSPSKG